MGFFSSLSQSSLQASGQLPSFSVTGGSMSPIRLIYCDEKGQFKIDPEAIAILQLIKEPICVISICGPARQGKSFLLNQILSRRSGFQVSSGYRPCTKGFWFWIDPIKRTAVDGTEYNLLLLDMEGINYDHFTTTYARQIFSLPVILSSIFLYNQMGFIDQVAIDGLSLVTEITKHIRVRVSGEQSTISELGQFSPIFVCVMRDFFFTLDKNDREITPTEYLENVLSPIQGTGRNIGSKNEILASIRAIFPDRKCFPLVRPIIDENNLRRLDQIPFEELRPEFRTGLDELTKYIFERARPKQIGGKIMTGPILVRITELFLDDLNKGVVPTITSSWLISGEEECQRAYDLAIEAYMKSFDRSKPLRDVEFREIHEEAVRKSTTIFNNNVVGNDSLRLNFEKRLQKLIEKSFDDFKKDVVGEEYLECSKEIENMDKTLLSCRPDEKIGVVIKVFDELVSKYEASFNGPEKWGKLVAILKEKYFSVKGDKT